MGFFCSDFCSGWRFEPYAARRGLPWFHHHGWHKIDLNPGILSENSGEVLAIDPNRWKQLPVGNVIEAISLPSQPLSIHTINNLILSQVKLFQIFN